MKPSLQVWSPGVGANPRAEKRSARRANGVPAQRTVSAKPSPLATLSRGLRWLLAVRMRIQRRSGRYMLQISLPPPDAQPDVATAARRIPKHRSDALRRDFLQLHALLARQPGLRQSMPQLSYVERTLARTGSRGLLVTPKPMLDSALDQLGTVERQRPELRLDELRVRLESAARALARRPTARENSRQVVEVSEVSHSLFEELDRSWTVPAPLSDSGH
ncbi:MAG: hypothetical protein ABL900_11735 [Burkholderiaceae bacterium]